jgi:hypothetical protein
MKPLARCATVAAFSLAAMASRADPAPKGQPLADWQRAHAASCGVVVDVVLSAAGPRGFADVTVANSTAAPVTLLADDATLRFSGGRVRRPLPTGTGDVTIATGSTTSQRLEFPDKADLQGQDAIEIEIVTAAPNGERCVVPVRVERDRSKPVDSASYLANSSWEVPWGAGVGPGATGSLGQMTHPPQLTMDVGLAHYPWLHHGFTADAVITSHGTPDVPKIDPSRQPGDYELTGVGLFVGYSARTYLLPWLLVAWQPSVGPYLFELSEKDAGALNTQVVFAVRNRVRLSARVLSLPSGTDLSLAASAVQLWIPHGSLGNASMSGNAFSGLLAIVFGW